MPVHKGGGKDVLQNYRPISVLPSINKIFETIFNGQLVGFLKYTNFLSQFHYGFRKGSNTSVATVELLNFINHHLDHKRFSVVSGLLIDLKKAFDTVQHPQLLHLCHIAGIRGLPYSLLESYLSDRSQVVCVNGVLSSSLKYSIGVPQGSVLGPTLFLLFINDIETLPLNGKINLYADDSALFYVGKSDSETAIQMNEDLVLLSEYFRSKKLTMNEKKTKLMHVHAHSKNLENTIAVHVNRKTVETVDNIVYLGLHLDSHLTWEAHTRELCKQMRPMVGILYKLSRTLPQKQLLNMYYAFIHSHITYLIGTWGHAAACHLKPLQALQNRALKIVFGLDRLTPSIDLYCEFAKGILPIKGLLVNFSTKFVKQILNNEIHHTLAFPIRNIHRNLRNPGVLYSAPVRTNFGEKKYQFSVHTVSIAYQNPQETFLKHYDL